MCQTLIGIETEKRIWCDPFPQRSGPLYRRTGVKGGLEKYTCFLDWEVRPTSGLLAKVKLG